MQHILLIIIPIYNMEKYLYECIESVVQQNLESYEIILIDGTDNYELIIPTIRCISNEINLGVSVCIFRPDNPEETICIF